jgi:hypothetical protein
MEFLGRLSATDFIGMSVAATMIWAGIAGMIFLWIDGRKRQP